MNKDDYDDSIEKQYGYESRKESRKQRKIASQRDRSKFKKTDQKKETQAPISTEGLIRGRVIEIHSQGMTVDAEGQQYLATLRGVFKKEKTRDKNLVAVGDYVLFQDLGSQQGCIYHVEPRETILSRADNLSRLKQQILATNVDQVLITVSIGVPPVKPFLVDRYIIAAQKGGLKPVIVVNKIDLLDSDPVQREILEEMKEGYAKIGILLIETSATAEEGLAPLRATMKGRTSVFSGQSGVGKSSLINAVTGLDLRTGETIAKTRKGAHTTTHTRLIPLTFDGWCVDTPGIKSFGVWDLTIEELDSYFDEIKEISFNCKFDNCSHTHEPDCAVRAAYEEGSISKIRYESYLQLRESVGSKHFRR